MELIDNKVRFLRRSTLVASIYFSFSVKLRVWLFIKWIIAQHTVKLSFCTRLILPREKHYYSFCSHYQ